MRTILIPSLLLALAATAAQAQQPGEPPCTIVFSKGQNLSSTDPKVNEMWNRLNNGFGQFVADELRKGGKRVVEMPHPVEATDTGANTDRVLKEAQRQGCNSLAIASMYADQNTRQFVSSLRVSAITATRSESPAGTNYAVGDEKFRKQQADPLTRETLDRLVPSEIARALVGAYLGQP